MGIGITKEPDMAEVISAGIENALHDVHTCLPGIVLNYYPDSQTVDVQLSNKQIFEQYLTDNILSEEFPVLPNLPICFPAGGGIHVTFPLVEGDNVIVLFSETDINNFRNNNTPNNDPGFLQRHGLSGSMAIPCRIANKTYSATYVDSSSVVISGGGAADFLAQQQKVMSNLNAIASAFSAHTHSYSWTNTPGSSVTGASSSYSPTAVACTKLKSE